MPQVCHEDHQKEQQKPEKQAQHQQKQQQQQQQEQESSAASSRGPHDSSYKQEGAPPRQLFGFNSLGFVGGETPLLRASLEEDDFLQGESIEEGPPEGPLVGSPRAGPPGAPTEGPLPVDSAAAAWEDLGVTSVSASAFEKAAREAVEEALKESNQPDGQQQQQQQHQQHQQHQQQQQQQHQQQQQQQQQQVDLPAALRAAGAEDRVDAAGAAEATAATTRAAAADTFTAKAAAAGEPTGKAAAAAAASRAAAATAAEQLALSSLPSSEAAEAADTDSSWEAKPSKKKRRRRAAATAATAAAGGGGSDSEIEMDGGDEETGEGETVMTDPSAGLTDTSSSISSSSSGRNSSSSRNRRSRSGTCLSASSRAKQRDDLDPRRYEARLRVWRRQQRHIQEETVELLPNRFIIPSSVYENLFSYQQEGVRWMLQLFDKQTGGLLGDDMGLGKTVQTAAFLAALHASGLLQVKPHSLSC
ncbi:hypothetical protein ACSSS7_007299 [Eimeria intestinalis]